MKQYRAHLVDVNSEYRDWWHDSSATVKVLLLPDPDMQFTERRIAVWRQGYGRLGYLPLSLSRLLIDRFDQAGGFTMGEVTEQSSGESASSNNSLVVTFTIPDWSRLSLQERRSILSIYKRTNLTRYPRTMAFSGDEELLAGCTLLYEEDTPLYKGLLTIWQVDPFEQVSEVEINHRCYEIVSMAVTQSGDRAAILFKDKAGYKIQVWEVWTGELLATLEILADSKDSLYKSSCDLRFVAAQEFLLFGYPTATEYVVQRWRTDNWAKVQEHRVRDDGFRYQYVKFIFDPEDLALMLTKKYGERAVVQWLDLDSLKITKELEVVSEPIRLLPIDRHHIALDLCWPSSRQHPELTPPPVLIVESRNAKVVDSFTPPPHDFVKAVLPQYHLFIGENVEEAGEYAAVDVLCARDYASSEHVPITEYLNDAVEWEINCVSLNGRFLALTEFWGPVGHYSVILGPARSVDLPTS